MFDFIPVYSYESYFHYGVLLLILILLWQCRVGSVLKKDVCSINSAWGFLIGITLILYIGLRPMSSAFGDTLNYYETYQRIAASKQPFSFTFRGEWLFYDTLSWFAHYSDIHTFFLLCSFLYIGPLWLACVRIFKNYNYIPFVVFLSMFTFWSYGVNGVRNGIAASLFILALTYVQKLPIAVIICIIASFFHKSVYLMIAAAGLAWFIKNSYLYLGGWILSVIISYLAGNRIQSWLSALSFFQEDTRFTGYLTGENMQGELVQMAMVFRWDFLAYSALGVAVGYYFIFRRNFKDEYYHWIYNIYIATNAFWVIIIRAAYSNRFAQISWFILPLVLIYPFMKKRFWDNHEKMLGYAIIIFYAFAFYTNIYSKGLLF